MKSTKNGKVLRIGNYDQMGGGGYVKYVSRSFGAERNGVKWGGFLSGELAKFSDLWYTVYKKQERCGVE